MFLSELTFPVTDLEGIGPSAARSLAGLKIVNVAQLLRHYPLRYDDRMTPVPLVQSRPDRPAMTVATVMEHGNFQWKKGAALKVVIADDSDMAEMLCFGRNFLANKLPIGQKIRIAGPFVRNSFGQLQSSSFVFEPYSDDPSKEFGHILPIYPLGGTLSQGLLRRAIRCAIDRYTVRLHDELPTDIMQSKCISTKLDNLREIHFPESIDSTMHTRHALIFEELFHFQFAVARRRAADRNRQEDKRPWNTGLPQKLLDSLPFTLTPDQQKTLADVQDDISSPGTMNRLVQGEVGSGKTLVAFVACLGVIGAGRQAAFMAPTELLAQQHADNAARFLEPVGIRVAYLSGELTGSARRSLLEALSAGDIDLLVGTHALFSGDVLFRNLGLAIVDEQQRFGVDQRRALADKGLAPDILSLSATPIPRTLALTAFGDMDVSSIKTMPPGRQPVSTHLTRIGNESKVYNFVRQELESGHQAYFVYPLIEESDKSDLKDAENMFLFLQTKILPEYSGALVHSRVDEEEKHRIMEDFHAGKLHYLTSTSVVEVGVDVPNASCMVVENAERFGLSALHQLRGRVGRGEARSYCFLLYNEPLTDDGKKRLMTMKRLNDGFAIAEEDLKIRGPGDMAGVRQSGFPKFSIADPVNDLSTLLEARDSARAVLQADPELSDEKNLNLKNLFETCPPFDENLLSTL